MTEVSDIVIDSVDQLWNIARVCHEANRAYALATGEDPNTVHGHWADTTQAIRDSAYIGVKAALDGATPERLHESWFATKVADGWRYGVIRDNEAKRHPCMVPYGDLPEAQRKKDALFQAIVAALK
jgi:hypothetical protein